MLLSAYHEGWKRQQRDAGEGLLVRFNEGQNGDSLHTLADMIIASFLTSALNSRRFRVIRHERDSVSITGSFFGSFSCCLQP